MIVDFFNKLKTLSSGYAKWVNPTDSVLTI